MGRLSRWLGIEVDLPPQPKDDVMPTVEELQAQLDAAIAEKAAADAAQVDPATLPAEGRFAQLEARLAEVERRLNGGAVA